MTTHKSARQPRKPRPDAPRARKTTPRRPVALAQAPSPSLPSPAAAPRTPRGKARSKYNALAHGVFSPVVLRDEPHSAYSSLLRGLMQCFSPQGAAEIVLVEKLAALLWRHRRMLVAEGAEIRSATEFLDGDVRDQERELAQTILFSSLGSAGGLIAEIQNPPVLRRCLDLLAALRRRVEEGGFDLERDSDILKKIYGDEDDWVGLTLPEAYASCQLASEESEEEEPDDEDCEEEGPQSEGSRFPDPILPRFLDQPRSEDAKEEPDEDAEEEPEEEDEEEPAGAEQEGRSKGHASEDSCLRTFLQALDLEVRRLRQYQKTQAVIAKARAQLQALRLRVPGSPALDRLLKYEASLERSFDRTLVQLERLQRARAGLPLPPPLKVEVS